MLSHTLKSPADEFLMIAMSVHSPILLLLHLLYHRLCSDWFTTDLSRKKDSVPSLYAKLEWQFQCRWLSQRAEGFFARR